LASNSQEDSSSHRGDPIALKLHAAENERHCLANIDDSSRSVKASGASPGHHSYTPRLAIPAEEASPQPCSSFSYFRVYHRGPAVTSSVSLFSRCAFPAPPGDFKRLSVTYSRCVEACQGRARAARENREGGKQLSCETAELFMAPRCKYDNTRSERKFDDPMIVFAAKPRALTRQLNR